MLSPATLAYYRQLTPGQRLDITLRLQAEALRSIAAGGPVLAARRAERLRQENDERNERIVAALRLSESPTNSE